jgi:hypothetical protein
LKYQFERKAMSNEKAIQIHKNNSNKAKRLLQKSSLTSYFRKKCYFF